MSYERREAELDTFLEEFWREGGMGFNVTFPYKEIIAKKIGCKLESVNTVVRGPKGWEGHTTDGVGFAAGLEHAGHNLDRFAHLVFLGNGGAAMALAKYAAAGGMEKITFVRRSGERDQLLRSSLRGIDLDFVPFTCTALRLALHAVQGKTLLVQATSAPLHGEDLSEFIPAIGDTFAGMIVDLVYGRTSALYQAAKTAGILHQDGLPMLLEQARAAQQIWWGESAPYPYLIQLLKN